MNNITLNNPQMHPSQFQNDKVNIKSNLKNNRSLLSISEERSKILATSNLDKLSSPGTYKFTTDDTSLDGSNTNSLFKNLYGETLLTFLFFSEDNINNIQKLIRMVVFKEMKQVIDTQSNTELMVIMRSIFLSYSEHPRLINESMSEKEKASLLIAYTTEVDRLNQLVINESTPLVISQLQQYVTYLYDASTPLKIMDKPISTSVAGTKAYRSITSVLIGSSL
jgi:hypothetical protein